MASKEIKDQVVVVLLDRKAKKERREIKERLVRKERRERKVKWEQLAQKVILV
jgi:hypothetical protein